MSYLLLTGATGLLGRYLLCDLTLAREPLAVVARPTRRESAAQRIETAIVRWEQELGRELVRPIVLSGDISQPLLGLGQEDRQWVAANCDRMLHSAASLTFYADGPEGEPWRSNIQGTRHVLELCQRAGIKQFHHVSTAYVCGQRRGRILESELDVGQTLGNDYEKSKITSEKEVLAADFLSQVTVYRPSIIVGDSRTGFTTSFHGFYTPLRLMHSLIKSVPWNKILESDWLGGLSLDGSEHKNLVAVDWVSAAMTRIITRPELHGATYHLTNPQAATVADMVTSIADALGRLAADSPARTPSAEISDEMVTWFREQMKIYQSYWSNDPDFDSANTQAALPHLPCPATDRPAMDRLTEFALNAKFGWPVEPPAEPAHTVQTRLEKWLAAGRLSSVNGDAAYVNLEVCGRGGGQWRLVVRDEELVEARPGVAEGEGPHCYLNATTFEKLARGDLAWDRAIDTGRIVVTGVSAQTSAVERLFRDLFSY